MYILLYYTTYNLRVIFIKISYNEHYNCDYGKENKFYMYLD